MKDLNPFIRKGRGRSWCLTAITRRSPLLWSRERKKGNSCGQREGFMKKWELEVRFLLLWKHERKRWWVETAWCTSVTPILVIIARLQILCCYSSLLTQIKFSILIQIQAPRRYQVNNNNRYSSVSSFSFDQNQRPTLFCTFWIYSGFDRRSSIHFHLRTRENEIYTLEIQSRQSNDSKKIILLSHPYMKPHNFIVFVTLHDLYAFGRIMIVLYLVGHQLW